MNERGLVNERLFRQFKEEVESLAQNPQRVVLDLDLVELWAVFVSLQLFLRHPGNTGPVSEIVRKIAVRMQDILSGFGSAIAEVVKMGWQAEFDQKREGNF